MVFSIKVCQLLSVHNQDMTTVGVSIQSIASLVRVSEGDLRKAITFLQCAARLSVDKEITERTIIEIAGVRHTV